MNSKNLAAFILATVIAAPAFADRQATVAAQLSGLTPAQVRADLVQLESAGWRPFMNMGYNPHFPDGIQAAEARMAAQNGATGVGGVLSGSSVSDAPAAARPAADDGLNPIYSGS
jgi:hypothetical protein